MRPRNALFLLPSALTTAALFCGLYAIIMAREGDWSKAALYTLIAALFDSCDGLVARLTKTESRFGVELDSLSDMVAFGAAPALMLYEWSLIDFGKIGFGLAFFYCAAVAMRLARFNTQVSRIDKRYFIGIPCPAAALIMVSMIASAEVSGVTVPTTAVALFSAIVSLAMVSGIRYPSIKSLEFKQRLPFRAFFFVAFVLIIINALAEAYMLAIFAVSFAYLAYGYFSWLVGIVKRRQDQRPEACISDDDSG